MCLVSCIFGSDGRCFDSLARSFIGKDPPVPVGVTPPTDFRELLTVPGLVRWRNWRLADWQRQRTGPGASPGPRTTVLGHAIRDRSPAADAPAVA